MAGDGNWMAEKDRRWRLVRDLMEKRQLDALVVAGARFDQEPLDRYLSGWIPGNLVIFPLHGDPILLVSMVPEMLNLKPDTPEEERPWINDIRPGVRGTVIADILSEKGLQGGRVGTVGLGGLKTAWEGWVPYRTWERVIAKLPRCTFEDVTSEYAAVTLVKCNEEIAQIRQAAEVLEEVSREVIKTTRPGATELDVHALVHRILSLHGLYFPMLLLRSGPNTISWGESPWLFGVGKPRVFQPGDVVLAEIFASRGSLEAQVQMAVAIPPVSSVNAECARLARSAYEEGLRNLQPGKTFAEVVGPMQAVLDRPGVWNLTPLIHSMNPQACIGPTTVGVKSASVPEQYRKLGVGRIRGGDVVLKPGMVFELEPNACIENCRVNVGGTVLVTEKGPEPLNELATRMCVAAQA
jgi:Xaa-Pro aminopeptidase